MNSRLIDIPAALPSPLHWTEPLDAPVLPRRTGRFDSRGLNLVLLRR
jgi:hypothetical protein